MGYEGGSQHNSGVHWLGFGMEMRIVFDSRY